MTSITLYTRPSCQPCKQTKRVLDREDVPYQEVDISQDPQALEAVRELGYMQAPVVVVRPNGADSDVHWSGLNPAMIQDFCITPHKEKK